jgi:hypothetical protein
MFGWTVSLMPIPREWDRAIEILAPIAERSAQGRPAGSDEILDAALAALGIAHHEVDALLAWGHR